MHQARVFSFTKSGGPILNPSDFANRAGAEIQAIPDGATFIVRKSEQGLEHLLVTDNAEGQTGVAFNMAQTIHAHSTELDETPDLGAVDCIARLVFGSNSSLGQSTQSGAEVTTVAEVIGASLRVGDWVGMTLRRPSKSEQKAQSAWLRNGHKITTHQSLTAGARVASIWAGGGKDTAPLNVTRLASALAGFGIHAEPEIVSGARMMRQVTGFGFAAAAVGVAWGIATPKLEVFAGWFPWWNLLTVLGILIGAYGVAAGTRRFGRQLPGPWRSFLRLLAWGRLPVASRRLARPKPPEQPKFNVETQTMSEGFEGEYPLARDGFMVAPHYPFMVVAPHAGAFSGSGSTSHRDAPPALLDSSIGPQIGLSQGVPVFLTWHDLWSGVFLVGKAGSGKTALLEWIWGESCRQVAEGRALTPIGIDTKLDGKMTQQMLLWGQAHGVEVAAFHVADTESPLTIDLFPREGSPYVQAGRILDAFIYLHGEVSIGAQSKDTLTRVFTAALTVTPSLIVSMPGNGANDVGLIDPDRSPFYYANVLLGGLGEGPGQALAEHIMMRAVQPDASEELQFARQQLMPLYSAEITPSKRREWLSAPRNKVAPMLSMEHWWSAPLKVSWADLLNSHQPIVVNLGVAPNGMKPANAKITEEMGSLLLYTMRREISEHCGNWQEQGRAVRIFADEVKAVAATSPEVVAWLRSDGRAFGVELVFATQQPSQLERAVRQAVMSFGTLVAFSQNEEETAVEIAKNLSLDGSSWSMQDVTTLPQFHAIVKTTIDQTLQPAFTILVPNFREDHRDQLAA